MDFLIIVLYPLPFFFIKLSNIPIVAVYNTIWAAEAPKNFTFYERRRNPPQTNHPAPTVDSTKRMKCQITTPVNIKPPPPVTHPSVPGRWPP